MNIRTFEDMNHTIIQNLPKIPRDVDLIVGIPKSGMLPATLMALYLDKPLTDIDSFINNRVYSSGQYHETLSGEIKDGWKVLFVDDTSGTGREMARVQEKAGPMIKEKNLTALYAAVYTTKKTYKIVDFSFERVPGPRVTEWNVMRHFKHLAKSCIDIDGVLCRNPTTEERGDSEKYLNFLKTAEPMFLPRNKVAYLVTCRREKYRKETEEWLQRHGVEYGKLLMLNRPEYNQKTCIQFKVKVYRKTDTILFIESNAKKSEAIAKLTGKPVFCIDNHKVY